MRVRNMAFTVVAVSILLVRCAVNPSNVNSPGTGKLEIRARITTAASLKKLLKTTETTCDTLIIQSSAVDMDTLWLKVKMSGNGLGIVDTALSIPAGKNRTIQVYTKNNQNLIIHTSAAQTTDLLAGETKTLLFWLNPVRGSIYVSLTDIPTSVDSIIATFTAVDNSQWRTGCKRSTKLFLSLDNIPDNTQGTLKIMGLGVAGDTIFLSTQSMLFKTNSDSSVTAQFKQNPGSLSVNATLQEPGVTEVTGSMGSPTQSMNEHGGLIISEIMYAVDDSEYIEVYNPAAHDTTFDTLIIRKDNTNRIFDHITVKAQGFFVFGRRPLPWVNAAPSVQSALDLSSTIGNWITILYKDSTVLDRLAFAAGSNSQEWPNLGSSKTSIVLDSLTGDPTYNNYGKHWVKAQSIIDNSITQQKGTPGKAGI